MTTLIFVAAARRADDGGFTARFQDLPQLSVQGADMVALLIRSREAVRQELQRLSDEGLAWPAATPFDEVTLEPGAAPFLVDITVEDPAVRVNISISERLLGRVDHAAQAAGMSRSAYIAEAVRLALGERRGKGPAAELDAVAKTLQEEWSQLGRKLTESLGPNSAFNRNLTEFDAKVSETIRKTAEGISAAMARRMEAERRAASGVDGDTDEDRTGPVN